MDINSIKIEENKWDNKTKEYTWQEITLEELIKDSLNAKNRNGGTLEDLELKVQKLNDIVSRLIVMLIKEDKITFSKFSEIKKLIRMYSCGNYKINGEVVYY